MLISSVVLAVAACAIPIAVTSIERVQARNLAPLEPYTGDSSSRQRGSGSTAVIYFSRSGNTALAARHVANALGARLVEIRASEYELGIAGWIRALWDARSTEAAISPRTLDLSDFDTIYLGSPIWLYSPAPPIWAFVRHNRFDGKRVVLFNTFNSQFGDEYVARFNELVMARGAEGFEHKFVRRGRMTQQVPPKGMLEMIDVDWELVPSHSTD